MKNIQFFAFTTILLLLVACNKDQQTVKKLDGTWKLTEYNGQPPSEENPESMLLSEITFNSCKLAENEYCDGSLLIGGFISLPIDFNVQGDGEKIGFKIPEELAGSDSTGVSTDLLLDIVTLTNKELTVQLDGSVLEFEKK